MASWRLPLCRGGGQGGTYLEGQICDYVVSEGLWRVNMVYILDGNCYRGCESSLVGILQTWGGGVSCTR